jgi:hypothetical protein
VSVSSYMVQRKKALKKKKKAISRVSPADLAKRVNTAAKNARAIPRLRRELFELEKTVKNQVRSFKTINSQLKNLTENVDTIPLGKLQIQFENLGQELTLNHQESRAINTQVKKNTKKLRGLSTDALVARLVELEDVQGKQSGRLELIRVLAERMDRLEQTPAGASDESLSDMEKVQELHTRQIRQLENRFREHLDELRLTPENVSDDKLVAIEKRLDSHDVHRQHIEDKLLAMQVSHGNIERSTNTEKRVSNIENVANSETSVKNVDTTINRSTTSNLLDSVNVRTTDEELAKYLTELYFKEIARHSFKRSLSLDDTLNAYNFVRKRISEHKMIRAQDIEQAIRAQQ